MKPKTTKLVLIAIVALAAILRFIKLTSIPISLYSDEVAIGYNAHSILKTGRDEFGEFLPLSFRALNDFKPPFVTYLVAISQSIFGISDWAVRAPAALFGTLSVVLVYFLAKQLKLSNTQALLASLFVAINPWQMMFSRATLAMGFALTLIIAATVSFLHGLKKPQFLTLSAVVFALSLYTYHAARVFSPLFVLVLASAHRKKLSKLIKPVVAAVLVGFVLTLPLIVKVFSPEVLVRPLGVSIFQNPPTPNPYEMQLTRLLALREALPDPLKFLPSIIYNRRFVSLYLAFIGYIRHFSPEFLFISHPHPQFQISGTSLFYLWETVTIPIGLFFLFRQNSKAKIVLTSWLLLGPLASAFTFSTPAVGRAIFMATPLSVFSGIGFIQFFKALHRRSRLLAQLGVITASAFVLTFVYNYFTSYAEQTSTAWGWEYKQAMAYVQANQDKYEKIVFIPKVGTGFAEPHIYLLYNLRYNPATYLSQGGSQVCRFGHSGRYNFGKYEFRTINCEQEEPRYISLEDLPENSLVIGLKDIFSSFQIKPIRTIRGSDINSTLVIYSSDQLTDAI